MTPEQIRALAKAGQLDAATTHVWREGLEDWKTLEDSGLLAAPAPRVAGAFPMTRALERAPRNAYLASEQIAEGTGMPVHYPGWGRLAYFLINMGVTGAFYAVLFVVMFAAYGMSGSSGKSAVIGIGFFTAGLVMFAACLFVAYQRVKNLGMSGWALLWTLVPFMNVWIGWRMIACPAGYEDHRTLDTAGKVISGIMAGFIGLAVVANILAVVFQS